MNVSNYLYLHLVSLTLIGICFSTPSYIAYPNKTYVQPKRDAQNVCGPIQSLVSEEEYCISEEGTIACPENGEENATVLRYCSQFYSNNGNQYVTYTCNTNGTWTSDGFCEAECGDKNTGASPLIVGGEEVTKYEFPWVAAIYTSRSKLCGATIISAYYVITVAHCYTYSNGTSKNETKFTVRAGKHYRNINKYEISSQERKIKNLNIHEQYNGAEGNTDFNIALVEIWEPFRFSSEIRPICIDWSSIYEDTALKDGNIGTVTGWGFIGEMGPRSKVVRKLEVAILKTSTCFYLLPEKYRDKLLTSDKFCAGYMNASRSVCVGDGGAGLFFESNKRNYLRGIASNMVAKLKGCDSNHYAQYTKISHYLGWIKSLITKNDKIRMNFKTRVGDSLYIDKTKACSLPPHIPHGRFSLPNNLPYIAYQVVPQSTVLYLTCTNRTNDIINFYCIDNRWEPLGDVACPAPGACSSLSTSESEDIICRLNGSRVGCHYPLSGTIAKIRCLRFYTLSDNRNIYFCRNGKWNREFIPCIPECGTKTVASETLIIGGVKTQENEYPWVVAVYNSTDDHICGGSVISRNYVLSAAHCFTNNHGSPHNRGDYSIVAGKHYSSKLANETDAQERRIKSIHIHSDYRGMHQHYRDDIALIELDDQFYISANVRPVCIDWESNYEGFDFIDGTEGIVAGWGYTTSAGSRSKVLKKLVVPYRDNAECKKHFGERFVTHFLTSDKICAGYANNDSGVCKGDSGGGLYFKNNGRYYVRGITSLTAQTELGCNANLYALYTKVSKYLQWIEDITRREI